LRAARTMSPISVVVRLCLAISSLHQYNRPYMIYLGVDT